MLPKAGPKRYAARDAAKMMHVAEAALLAASRQAERSYEHYTAVRALALSEAVKALRDDLQARCLYPASEDDLRDVPAALATRGRAHRPPPRAQ